jgi:exopolyphosphatase / guanosine-5'-triphosphate,3'-diphosphate pyrophosphatase
MNQPDPPLAAIDMGSNTIHVVVARPRVEESDLDVLADDVTLVRLGADVNATGIIGPERLGVALETLGRYLRVAREQGAATVLGVATEGIRAARNGSDVLRRIQDELGLAFTVVTGEQEAALTFWGATSGRPSTGKSAVIDLGGGSMELVVGTAAHVEWRVSLPLGSGAVHDRLAPADPADPAELAQAARVVADTLDALDPPVPVVEVVACGGTATTLAALARSALSLQPPPGPPGATEDPHALPDLTPAILEDLLGLLQSEPAAVIAEQYTVEAGRAVLLAAGAVVLRGALARLGGDRLRISSRGIREGAILAYARHGDAWLAAAERG